MTQATSLHLHTDALREAIPTLHVGQNIYLHGTVFTARDAAHKRLCAMIQEGKELPFQLKDAVIYYAGPTPTKPNGRIGSIGPTTSSRMDKFAPVLLANGLVAMIGKGNRNEDVCNAIRSHNGIYFCASGGLGALISKSVISCEEIAFAELGCESIKRLTIEAMPVTVAILPNGDNIFELKDQNEHAKNY
ncbi:MAG: fumarate hydratase C-terminal domain-containing protein [Clostridia bacterium]|nr:fumarate hydratase C-terminal domain-containing protein [Clostridia bacterium]MBR6781053.1 fumarate hydratase C-terminal domain-containing protein [Clostridia bacterium]